MREWLLVEPLGVRPLLTPSMAGVTWYGIRSVFTSRTADGIPTLDGRPPFDSADEPDDKAPG